MDVQEGEVQGWEAKDKEWWQGEVSAGEDQKRQGEGGKGSGREMC